MTEIYTEHLVTTGPQLTHIRLKEFADQLHKPEIEAIHAVPSASDDHAYPIFEVSILDKPFDDADVVEDRIKLFFCGCDDWYYNRSAGVENGDVAPSEINPCKHIVSNMKALKAQDDDDQTELLP